MALNKFLNKISYYFRDSYGMDKLSKHLYIGGLVILLIKPVYTLSFVFIVYSTWRCISKNKYKRFRELQAYENFISPLIYKIKNFINSQNPHNPYKIFKCPNCAQKLRVPRKKGKITITCNKCGTSFKGKS
ncbi:hypothetical protein [Clostridium sp.]|jgi:predicted RNA-binding Zn-ribbon protein involved in translation (DUF1610 family)|uniref:hypothetical protein n=1 Tax=Clostridium sp. TaxID=1506 RepID=UPI002FDE0BBE